MGNLPFPAATILVLLMASAVTTMEEEAPSTDTGSGGTGVGMAGDELKGVLEVVGELLEDPHWAELHPHPCTDTPWPGIQCEMVQSSTGSLLLHVTKLHIGPDVASPPCKPTATLSPSLLLKLPYLKSLSLFACFLSPSNSSSLPPSLFAKNGNGAGGLPSMLEQLVLNSNPGLTGEIPPTIAELSSSLRVLSLSQNGLTGGIPRELGRLSKLQQLDLSYNKLAGVIPEEIGELGGLAILDLSFNGLNGPVPPTIGRLKSLQKLDLSSNTLSGHIPPELGDLGNTLVLLDLSRNIITGPLPETLVGLKSLEYLMVENNPMNTTLPSFVGKLQKLAVLGMSGCGLWGPIPESLAGLHRLTALALDRNHLSGKVPAGLGTLPNLGQLNLSQNRLTGEVGFTEEFVRRLGKRLDVRDNNGLCTSSAQNRSALYQAAPPCSSSTSTVNGASSTPSSFSEGVGLRPMSEDVKNGEGSSRCRIVPLILLLYLVFVC